MDAYTLAQTIYSNVMVRVVLGLILANLAAAVFVSIKTGTFYMGELAEWLRSQIIPYLGGAGILQLVCMTLPEAYTGLASGIAITAWGAVILQMLSKLLENLAKLGVNIPTPLLSRKGEEIKNLAATNEYDRAIVAD